MSRNKIKVVKGEFGEWYPSPSGTLKATSESKILLGEFGDATFTVGQLISALQQFDASDRICLDNIEDESTGRSGIYIFSEKSRKQTKEELIEIKNQTAKKAASADLIEKVRARSYERLLAG